MVPGGDRVLQLGMQQTIVVWDGMANRYAHPASGGAILVYLELLLGSHDNCQLGNTSRSWQRCWSDSVRHGFLRAFGCRGYYSVPDHEDASDAGSDDDDDCHVVAQRGPGPWLPRFVFGR